MVVRVLVELNYLATNAPGASRAGVIAGLIDCPINGVPLSAVILPASTLVDSVCAPP